MKLFGKSAKGRTRSGKNLSRVGPTGDASGTPWQDPEKTAQQASAGTAGRRLRDQLKKNKSTGMKPPR